MNKLAYLQIESIIKKDKKRVERNPKKNDHQVNKMKGDLSYSVCKTKKKTKQKQ